ncbi:MAG: DUF2934 domain-containing protein [Deltaproteobacteria bacterium]|nr:DUF2934 domain-containing protein [Deltaproteobacteria bacterium]
MAKNEARTRKASATVARRKTREAGTTLSPPLMISDEELYERVASKAYELYQQRAEEPGHELDDWLTAERLVNEELLHGQTSEESLPVEEQ